MFTSAADVFRSRQASSDLMSYLSGPGHTSLRRLSSGGGVRERLLRAVGERSGRFVFPGDRKAYGEVLLAAALPDEDYPAFTAATALLLLDRIGGGHGEDDLYWNWDAFRDHYRLADPPIRAMLMNGFRVGATAGCVSLAHLPNPDDCLTRRPDQIVPRLRRSGFGEIAEAVEGNAHPETVGRIWILCSRRDPPPEIVASFRYFYERPASFAPPDPENAPLIAWR